MGYNDRSWWSVYLNILYILNDYCDISVIKIILSDEDIYLRGSMTGVKLM